MKNKNGGNNNPTVTPKTTTGGVGPKNAAPAASKAAVQMQKMRDANNKYKNLLKMAKERIEQQEIDLKELRGELVESNRIESNRIESSQSVYNNK